MVTTCEVIRVMGEIIATTEGMVTEIKITIGIGVGHLKDRVEIGEMIEVPVTVGLGQALGQVQIETESGALNVGSTTILQEYVQQDK